MKMKIPKRILWDLLFMGFVLRVYTQIQIKLRHICLFSHYAFIPKGCIQW